jgi:hypothetical protein
MRRSRGIARVVLVVFYLSMKVVCMKVLYYDGITQKSDWRGEIGTIGDTT